MQSQDTLLYKMMETFMVCNNVTPIGEKEERILQASSPDEVALVEFAEKKGGYFIVERQTNSMIIRFPDQREEKYTILQNFPFSSESKRMGLMVKNESNQEIYFFVKGADSVIMN